MTIHEALRTYVLADTAISALVGDRMSPAPMNEGAAFPYITYQQISNARKYSHSGQITLCKPRFQINAWAATRLGAATLAELIRIRLSGYKGSISSITTQGIFCEGGEVDIEEESPDQDARRAYGIAQDFFINYQETAAAFSQ